MASSLCPSLPTARLSELRKVGLESIGMTTNGIALERRLPSLIEHGLTHLNLRYLLKIPPTALYANTTNHSLDTLDPFKFEIMTRRRGHEAVLRSLEAALLSNLRSVKLNVVIVKGLNDAEVLDFLEMTKDTRLSVRFIEFMPFTGTTRSRYGYVFIADIPAQVTNGTRRKWCPHPSSWHMLKQNIQELTRHLMT